MKRIPKSLAALLMAFCVLVSLCPAVFAAESPFIDVTITDWYYSSVLWAKENGITGGKTADTFAPNEGCTRAQVVTFLWAANGKPELLAAESPFTDVSPDDWYYKPVIWAVKQGITKGISDTEFGPEQTCTRAQIVTFLYAAKGRPAVTGSSSFSDVADSDWYAKPVIWALQKNITSGIGDGRFGPDDTCTRAQVVTFLSKAYGKNTGHLPLPTITLIPLPTPTPSAIPVPVPITPKPVPMATPTPTPQSSELKVHFIDVGQADAALIECDGHYMLIDGGNKADSSKIYSVLKEAQVPKLDLLVATHAHEDHVGGLAGALNYTEADLILCPVTDYDSEAFRDFVKYADLSGGITVPKAGDTYKLGSATVTILGLNLAKGSNNSSIVLRIDHGENAFLFMGDAERDAELVLTEGNADLAADVLKVGHHGSDTSTTYPLLYYAKPQYAVISVGEGNSYGHPTEDTLSRLRDADVKLYRTDLQGDIYCTSDGSTLTFTVSRNEDADVFGGIGSNSTQPTPTPVADMVWIPKSGSKYHSTPDCSGMKNPTQITLEQAIARGYAPCKRCH